MSCVFVIGRQYNLDGFDEINNQRWPHWLHRLL